MSKRALEETKEEMWERKRKKYEKKFKKRQATSRQIIYSDEEDVLPEEHLEIETTAPAEPEHIADNDGTAEIIFHTPGTLDEEAIIEDIFDSELLQELGDEETDTVEYGDDLQTDVAARFQKILKDGLKKETREELYKKYPFPKNVPLSKGPTLNPEIGAMLVDTLKQRDKRLLAKQDRLGRALSAVGKALSSLLKKKPEIPETIRTLNDAGKLLADSHFAETETRQSVIIPLIDKTLSDPFKDRKRDSLLFGEKLGDLVRDSRGIKKTSQIIQASTPSTSGLNSRGPSSRGRQQRGGQPYQQRAGGPRPMMSYQYTYQNRRRAPAPPRPPPRRQPPPPLVRRAPPLPAQRAPASHST